MKLYGPRVVSVSFRGTVYKPDADGVFDVPDDATDLLSHGLSRDLPPKPAPKAPPVKSKF